MLCLILNAAFVCAQGRFDPNKVRLETHKFITKEANLSAQEASRFFLIYDEMRSKQRVHSTAFAPFITPNRSRHERQVTS